MKRFLLLGSLVASSLLAACGGGGGGTAGDILPTAPQQVNPTPLSYTALGDSITYGLKLPTTTDAYPYLVAASLGATVDDLGVPGYKTTDVTATEVPEIPANASLITIDIGTNDIGAQTPVATFATNYAQMLASVKARAPHAKIVLIGVIGPYDAYNAVISAQGLPYVNLNADARLLMGDPTISYDGTHPTPLGDQYIAQDVESVVNTVLH